MGKGQTYRYQIGRTYRIKKLFYDVIFSSTKKIDSIKKAKQYDDALVKKDLGYYTVLVPVLPSIGLCQTEFDVLLKKYKGNWDKLRG